MFDIGWLELIVIGVVALIVVGPKDLPGMFRTVGKFMGKARGMAREFQRSMEAAADESGIKDAAKGFSDATDGLKDIDKLGLNSATKSAKSYAKDFAMGKDDAAKAGDEKPATTKTETVKSDSAKTTPPPEAKPDAADAPKAEG